MISEDFLIDEYKYFRIYHEILKFVSKLVCTLKNSNIHLSTSIQISFAIKHSGKILNFWAKTNNRDMTRPAVCNNLLIKSYVIVVTGTSLESLVHLKGCE